MKRGGRYGRHGLPSVDSNAETGLWFLDRAALPPRKRFGQGWVQGESLQLDDAVALEASDFVKESVSGGR